MDAKKTKHSTRRARVVTQETDVPFLGIRDYPSQFDIDENKQCLLKCHKPHKVRKETKDIQVFLESFDFFKCEYFCVEDYLHKIECSVHPKHLVTTLWCPTIFKKDSPIANTPLSSLPVRLIFELESVRTYLSLNANPEIINQIIDHAIHCAHKLELVFKDILDIYQENHTKHTIRDWLFKFRKECGQLNRRFSPLLDEDARRKRTNLVWAISKAIDDLGLRELAESEPDTAILAEFSETYCGADKIAIDRAKIQDWAELYFDFIDDDTARYKIGDGRWVRLNYAELGFNDKRKSLPNQLWRVFKTLAQHSNGKAVDCKALSKNINKDLDRICDTLIQHFGPTERPINHNKKTKEWDLAFRLTYKDQEKIDC